MNTGIGNYRKMTALRKQGLKVSLGIGGWNEGSINYSMMASSSDRRKTFIASTVEFLRCVHRNIHINCFFYRMFHNKRLIPQELFYLEIFCTYCHFGIRN